MKDTCKILVLSDLNKSTSKTLKSSVGLAKIIAADINFFYVKKPTEVIEKESQLSAIRIINKEYFSIDKKVKDLISPISDHYNVNINYSFTIGNIKNQIERYLDENKPDIIVLGKRKTKIVNFIGDYITPFILKKHKRTFVIADDKNGLEPNKQLSLGLFNHTKAHGKLIENIINSTKQHLTPFKITENASNLKKPSSLEKKKTVEYLFEKGDNVIKNISNYLSQCNVNLLFVHREKTTQVQ